MNLLMDDVRLYAHAGETILRLAKRVPGTPPPAREAEPATVEENLRVVRDLFDAFAARDVSRTSQLVDRGVMMEPLSTPVERRTPYLGVDGLRRYLQDLDETWDRFDVTIEDVRADDGEHVVADGRILARQNDVAVDDPACFAFRLRDGKVVWAKVYRSHEEALAAVGWSYPGRTEVGATGFEPATFRPPAGKRPASMRPSASPGSRSSAPGKTSDALDNALGTTAVLRAPIIPCGRASRFGWKPAIRIAPVRSIRR